MTMTDLKLVFRSLKAQCYGNHFVSQIQAQCTHLRLRDIRFDGV